MVSQQLAGIGIAIGLLRHGKHDEAADWLQDLMTTPADEETLQLLRQLTEEIQSVDEIPRLD